MAYCSKTFRSVVQQLTTNESEVEIINSRHSLLALDASNELCLKSMVRSMGDDEISAHLHRFLSDYPYKQNLIPF